MKVLIAGANGQIGRLLVDLMTAEEGFEPVALVRKENQLEDLREQRVEALLGDLESPVDKLSELIVESQADAVVFTAGSGGKTGPDKTLLIDLDGAVKLMQAAEKTNAKRFLIVSAIGAHRREFWQGSSLAPYYVAKHFADESLMRSNLDWTVIRPGTLQNEPATGKVLIKQTLDHGHVNRADVAEVILECLKNDHSVGKAFDLVAGETPVKTAVAEL